MSIILLSVCFAGSSQTITTIAGNGSGTFNGEEGNATGISLWSPLAVAVSGGMVYVADGLNNRIRIITPSGRITTIAGVDDPGHMGDNGPATDAQLNHPDGIAVDNHGNIYIADKYNNRVRKINPKGIITAFAGNGIDGYEGDGGLAVDAQLTSPAGLLTDTFGNVYIADAGNNCIRVVNAQGFISTIAGTGKPGFTRDSIAATASRLNAPSAIALDSAGNLYIADSWNYRVRKVTTKGMIVTIAGTGVAGYAGDGGMDTAALLNLPTGLAVYKNNMYIADQGNNRIRRITPDGKIYTLAGTGNPGFSGDGGPAGIAELNAAPSLTVDAAGNIYVAEQQNNRVRKITTPPAIRIVKPTPKVDSLKSSNPPKMPPFSNGSQKTMNQQSPTYAPPPPPQMYNRRKSG